MVNGFVGSSQSAGILMWAVWWIWTLIARHHVLGNTDKIIAVAQIGTVEAVDVFLPDAVDGF